MGSELFFDFRRMVNIGAVLTLFATLISAETSNLAVVYELKGNAEVEYNLLAEKKIQATGYALSDPHKRVNDSYKEQFGFTALDTLGFMSIANEGVVKPLLNIDPRLGAFTPFNLLAYKLKNEDKTTITHLTPEVMLDTIGITDEKVRSTFIESFKPLDKVMDETLKVKPKYIKIASMAQNRMMNFEIPFKRGDDLEDTIDDFQSNFEEKFEKSKYLIAGYLNMKDTDGKDTIPDYDAFWVYSLCHMEFSYEMFDGKNPLPISGLFAPCSMYMYIRKGEDKIVVGMIRLSNWAALLGIKDSKKLKLIEQLDKEIPEIMKSIGAKEVPNINPLTQSKVKVATQASNNVPTTDKKAVAENIAAAPVAVAVVPSTKPTSPEVGMVKDGVVSTYLRGAYMTTEQAEGQLKSAGFEVIASASVDKSGKLKSIIFTHPILKKLADKDKRGFSATLRLLVDEDNKQISIANPVYFLAAFLQDQNSLDDSKELLTMLQKAFGGLKDSKENIKYDDLAKYHFMAGMPYYGEMIEVGKDASATELLSKVKSYNDGKSLAFSLKLSENRILVGINLSKRTGKFIDKIGTSNALLLPYPVLIENGQAKILDPKYYLALSYPMLSMSQFMTIATVPGAIEKDCKKIFK